MSTAASTIPSNVPSPERVTARLIESVRTTERAGRDAVRAGVGVGVVLAAEAAAGVGLWAAFAYLSGVRASRALGAAARGLGEP